MSQFGQSPRLPHDGDLGFALHRPLPVHQQVGIDEPGIGETIAQAVERARREIVSIALIADALAVEVLAQIVGGPVHRVDVSAMNEMLGPGENALRLQMGCQESRLRIHQPADPQRFAVVGDHHHLRRIERPGVEAGQPVDVRRVADDHGVEALAGHRLAHLGDTGIEFGLGKRWGHGRGNPACGGVLRDQSRRQSRTRHRPRSKCAARRAGLPALPRGVKSTAGGRSSHTRPPMTCEPMVARSRVPRRRRVPVASSQREHLCSTFRRAAKRHDCPSTR